VISVAVDVVIARTNSIVNSARVRKIVGSLKNQYRARVVGWNREGIPTEKRAFLTDLDLLNFRGPFGSTIIVFYLPVFWMYLFGKLIKYRPNVVHACDLDTLLPSLIFKMLFRKKLVFDVCDRYAMSKISSSNRLVYSFVNWLEEYLGQRADCMINVSEKRESTFKRKPRKTAIIMNCADDSLKRLLKVSNENKSIEGNYALTLVYTGNIIRKRGLEQINVALKKIENVQLIMAGKVIDRQFLDELLKQQNIKYCGQLSFPEALGLEALADVIVILYDPVIPNNRYANPNKLFEAMVFGVSVLTNVVEEIVQETNCGLLIEYGNIELLTKAIVRLRDDPIFRKKLGQNGRIAFERQYNWSSMEKRLLSLYEQLQKNPKL
jgi:glycosyltransferase involved in cell wall biosynthesis